MSFTGDPVTALDTVWDVQDTSGTTTNTTYNTALTGGTTCGVAFVAPASGKVLIHNSAYFFHSAASFVFVSFRLRTGGVVGSGVDVVAVDDKRCIVTGGVSAQTKTHPVSGLTPGASYNVQQLYRVETSGTGTILNKNLIVEPQP